MQPRHQMLHSPSQDVWGRHGVVRFDGYLCGWIASDLETVFNHQGSLHIDGRYAWELSEPLYRIAAVADIFRGHLKQENAGSILVCSAQFFT